MITATSHFNLVDLDFQVVVDWVEVRVKLASPSQPRHVRARMASTLPHWGTPPYVEAETDNSSLTSSSFVFRVQDPIGPDALLNELRKCWWSGEKTLTEADVEILAVEISLDAYPSIRSKEGVDLASVAHYLHLHHARPPVGTTRVTGQGSGATIWNHGGLRDELVKGHTINCGDVASDHRSRAYVKTYDTLDGKSYTPLAASQHRARLEVTLAGARMPFSSIAAWRTFNFSTLAKHLALRKSIESTDSRVGSLVTLLEPMMRRGKPDDQRKRAHHRRLTKINTKADTVTNKRIRTALERLTRQQRANRPSRMPTAATATSA